MVRNISFLIGLSRLAICFVATFCACSAYGHCTPRGVYPELFSGLLGCASNFIQTRKSYLRTISVFFFGLSIFLSIFLTGHAWAQSPKESVELNGDTVEYSVDGNKVTAQGNVEVVYQEVRLMCDSVEFSRDTKMAYAQGNVRLVTGQGEISGDRMVFNFETMSGDFNGAKIFSKPYFGQAKKISKKEGNEIDLIEGHMTTCDHDKPHFKMVSRKIEIYPGEKMVARRSKLVLGKVPLLYLPRLTQRLDGKKPLVVFTPGYNKEWGMFVLSKTFFHINDNLKGFIRVDAREKRDVAEGLDLEYKSPKTGSGLIRTYYMNERRISAKRFYKERPTPTIERERFKAEWRHKWKIDDNTILQYYKLSDKTLLKEYFEREFEKDSAPQTYFLLTRNLPKGTFSFRTDARVNRFESAVERLPEVRYDLSNEKIGETGLYVKDTTTFSNLTSKTASPSEIRKKTLRLDTENEISYPFKLGFVELKPFVGGRETFYSRTIDPAEYNSIRGIFRTGSSLSTKFYRLWETETDVWGMDIHRLRHIVTPTVSYVFQGDPTIPSSHLDSFDSIDSLSNQHFINFSIENKLQTKRGGETVELLRAILGTDFHLKEESTKGGFGTITSDIDFRPKDWLTLYFDAGYDTTTDRLSTANFDLYINGKDDRWSYGVGKRFNSNADDQLTQELKWKINPKWALRWYQRFDVEAGILKEQEYTIRRDLHEWLMDISFNETRDEGDEIWIIFTLKAFPDIALDVGSGFNERKAGSQSEDRP